MINHITFFTKKIKRNLNLKKESKNNSKIMSILEKKKEAKEEKFAKEFGVDFYDNYLLPKAYVSSDNAFFTYSGLIYFYPPNDGTAILPFSFYRDHDLVLRNTNDYSEIENLDEIILEMIRIFDKALDKKIAINPYSFMLKLEDELKQDYKGKATLVMTSRSITTSDYKSRKYFINRFLDHFIGWNFGVSVNRNENLKEALHKLNDKVIEKGLREDAGPGYGVYGSDTDVYKGLQHYTLPKSKENNYSKIKK